jgi:hypothetical protein
MLKKTIYLLLLFISVTNLKSFCQPVDTTSFKMNSRLSFYSNEKNGEMILHIPSSLIWRNLKITLKINEKELTSWKGIPADKLFRLPFSIDLVPGVYTINAEIRSSAGKMFRTKAFLNILHFKSNEVKTDKLTGGLIVNQRIFFPFGFYCYSPVHPLLPEEEVVKGFNMISPYQKILPETLNERKAYMDRCAQIGMKVHYNVLSVSGGGGVSSKTEDLSEDEKRELLINEIRTFMDHPALLAWYISDEPNGFKIPPEKLEEIYNLIKGLDPWHPVSIVFMAPFLSSRKYADALDIVMADPYPVPNGSVTQVGDVTKQLRSEFEGEKPVWIVPQAFGGGEWWGREPTIQELRTMTYQAIVNGATGIQYFVRHGLNSFPKSTSAWNECGRMAAEISGITPWLLSDEKSVPVQSNSANIRISSRVHNGQLLIIAVNRVNSPQMADINISGTSARNARVLFENRSVQVHSGTFVDFLPAFGSQVYLLNIKPIKETIKPFRDNLIRDPGFEDISSVGVPAACYSWNEGDRGSTYFLDSREHLEGNHSLRMVTPQENKGTRLRFFPINISKGSSYILSIWAKTDSVLYSKSDKPFFELGMGDYGSERFYPGNEWKQFVTSVTIPSDTIPSPRANAILRMPGKGTAWFDMIQVFEAVDMNRSSINPEIKGNNWDE